MNDAQKLMADAMSVVADQSLQKQISHALTICRAYAEDQHKQAGHYAKDGRPSEFIVANEAHKRMIRMIEAVQTALEAAR
ncbi:MAG TPA: hypothetical protein DHU81_06565 [Hyphomonas sp.]|nr:hypothetical protein [Hyphomonas sp.]